MTGLFFTASFDNDSLSASTTASRLSFVCSEWKDILCDFRIHFLIAENILPPFKADEHNLRTHVPILCCAYLFGRKFHHSWQSRHDGERFCRFTNYCWYNLHSNVLIVIGVNETRFLCTRTSSEISKCEVLTSTLSMPSHLCMFCP